MQAHVYSIISWWWNMRQIPAHQPLLHLTRHTSAHTSNLFVCVFSAYLTSDSSWILFFCTIELLLELSMSAQLHFVRPVATHQLSSTRWDSRNAVIPLQNEPTRSCNDKDLVAGKDGKDHQQQRKTVKHFSLGKDHQWTSITSSQHPCDDVAMMFTSKSFNKRITA